MITKSRSPKAIIAAVASTAVLSAGLIAGPASPSEAACKGSTSSKVVSTDENGGQTKQVKINSCKAKDLVKAYDSAKNASGLAGMLGAKWWPVGVAGGAFYGWAWANQSAVEKCSKSGKGIQFTEYAGTVMGCESQ